MSIIIAALIACLTTAVLGMLDKNKRRYYFFGAACVLLGVTLAVVGVSFRVDSVEVLEEASVIVQDIVVDDKAYVSTVKTDRGAYELNINKEIYADLPLDIGTRARGTHAVVWKHPSEPDEIVAVRSISMDIPPAYWVQQQNGTAKQLLAGGLFFCLCGILIAFMNFLQQRSGEWCEE